MPWSSFDIDQNMGGEEQTFCSSSSLSRDIKLYPDALSKHSDMNDVTDAVELFNAFVSFDHRHHYDYGYYDHYHENVDKTVKKRVR